jgi:hypothetical protein
MQANRSNEMTPFDLATGLRLGPAPVISVNVLADLGLPKQISPAISRSTGTHLPSCVK